MFNLDNELDAIINKALPHEVYPHNCDDACGHDHNDDYEPQKPYIRDIPKTGRNDPCPCGSGKKYKKCCLI